MFEKLDHVGAIILLALFICVPAYLIVSKRLGFKYRKQVFGTRKITGQSPDIPLEGSLLAAFFVLSNKERVFPNYHYPELTSALFLHWILDGRIRVCESAPGQPYPVYIFPEKDVPDNEMEKQLFRNFKKAAGSDRVLTRYEAYKLGRNHVEKFHRDMFTEHMNLWLEDHDYIRKRTLFNVFLTREGAMEARKVVELENYLGAVMAGTAAGIPDVEKVPYYVQFIWLDKKWPQFRKVLEEKPELCAGLAGLLGCSADKVVSTLDDVKRTADALWEGVDDETDKMIDD